MFILVKDLLSPELMAVVDTNIPKSIVNSFSQAERPVVYTRLESSDEGINKDQADLGNKQNSLQHFGKSDTNHSENMNQTNQFISILLAQNRKLST